MCPIALTDAQGLWSDALAPPPLSARLQLDPDPELEEEEGAGVQEVVLPVRVLGAQAALFRDTDHCFRWFLAPFAHLYVLDSLGSPSDLAAWVQQRRACAYVLPLYPG